MGKFYPEIPSFLVPWLNQQQVFWVATAPLDPEGHVNLSSKGVEGTFQIVDEHTVWYEDLTGSGVETIAHLRENGRITVFFNAFVGPPRICRLFGKGTVHEFGTPEYDALLPPEKRKAGSRAVIMINVHKVGTSCGYSVPFFEFKAHRQTLLHYFQKLDVPCSTEDTAEGTEKTSPLTSYWAAKNAQSIDGLPGLSDALEAKAGVGFQSIPGGEDGRKTKGFLGNVRIGAELKTLVGFSLGMLVGAGLVSYRLGQ